jgi:peptide/nickel transport system permease protein
MTAVAPTVEATRAAADAGERLHPFRQFVSDKLAAAGLVIVLLLTLAAVFASTLAPHDPTAIEPLRTLEGSSRDHLLGTDELGRDVLSRLLIGARWSMGIAALATLFVMVVGTLIGLVSGYIGGWLDTVLMRVVDSLLALPTFVLYLAIVGILGPGVRNVFIGLIAISWATYARVMRGLVLSARERAFVRASRSLGAGNGRLMLRHILPNVISPIVVLATLQVGNSILALAALGFFGLGAQPPTPEWGTMINAGRLFLETNPGLLLYPGIAISLAVLGFNLMGDGLRDVLDPQVARRSH